MNLSGLKPPAGQTKGRKRIGRGMGSGRGKTATRGSKGQRAGTGFGQKRGFEGGQMPLHRRLPKRGFTNIFRTEYAVVNLASLADLPVRDITPEVLHQAGLIPRVSSLVKILGEGELSAAFTVRAHKFSKSAAEKIAKAGGATELIERKVAPVERKKKTK